MDGNKNYQGNLSCQIYGRMTTLKRGLQTIRRVVSLTSGRKRAEKERESTRGEASF